ncbi:LOW QUALITY PROTEIN: uncharacterized protein EMH_0075840 [Eimeria mitis]|uniref:Uncharacterized protein n=1 Tax=Eimeria mitis TaxID=44415 RepID=U6KJ42_9EIME|nr:LOW QUALITY PROTEIN: uncharacterized protein EMH_0075840 [Eimeria mitis]CDJ36292.1 hypothetical protein, conserved [Eimeria mitis]
MRGLGAPDSGTVQCKTCDSDPSECGEEAPAILRGSTDPPQNSLGSSTQLSEKQQQQQQLSENAPVPLTPQQVDDISELCMQVILEHEAETASRLSSSPLQSVIGASSVPAGAAEGHDVNSQRTSGSNEDSEERAESRLSAPSNNPGPFAAYEAFTPACAQQQHATTAAGNIEASQDTSVPEQDVELYATRTITALLLAGPTPVRVEDLRRCWMALPMQLRKRNLTTLVLGRAASIAASCFGLQLMSFQVKGPYDPTLITVYH